MKGNDCPWRELRIYVRLLLSLQIVATGVVIMMIVGLPSLMLDAVGPFLQVSPSADLTRQKLLEQLGAGRPFSIAIAASVGGAAVLLTILIDRRCKALARSDADS